MQRNEDRQTGEDAALAARLRRQLSVNQACGDLSETVLTRFTNAIDAAEGRTPAAQRKSVAA